jgi:hypothetical protein
MSKFEETKNVVLILTPFDALTLLATLDTIQERKDVKRSLFESIGEFKKQVNEHVTTDQVDDAQAELAMRILTGTY